PLSVASSFPLDLFTARVIDQTPQTLEVFPRRVTLKRGWQRMLSGRQEGGARASERTGRSDGDFYGLRPYRDGDTLRKIHWRTSARLDEPVVTQYEQSRRIVLWVLVDGFQASPHSPDADVERAISVAATLVLRLAGSTMNRVVLVSAGRQPRAILSGGSLAQRREVLSLLARLEVTERPDLSAALERAAQVGGRCKDLLVLSPRSMTEMLESVAPQSRRQLERSLQASSLRWIDLSSPAECNWFEALPPPAEDAPAAPQKRGGRADAEKGAEMQRRVREQAAEGGDG
ncbi:MAG: DUF58 domain-containing protein, partial [Novipirellula sp. JB048]